MGWAAGGFISLGFWESEERGNGELKPNMSCGDWLLAADRLREALAMTAKWLAHAWHLVNR